MSSSSRLVLRDVPLDAALFVPALSVHRSNRKNQYLSEDQNKRRIFEQHIDRTKPSKSEINSAEKNKIFFPQKESISNKPKNLKPKRNQQKKDELRTPNRSIPSAPGSNKSRTKTLDAKKRRGKRRTESNQIERKKKKRFSG